MPASNFLRSFLCMIMLALALSATFVSTSQAATPAQAIKETTLREGPGANYAASSEVSKGAALYVERCHQRWCLVSSSGQNGWVSIDNITFGLEARGPYSGPKLDQPLQGSGTICFYSGENYSGQAICSQTGMVVRDLALHGRDNTFASISLEGDISAMVCRDFDFTSYCETIIYDQPRLSRFLNKAISSFRVW